MTFILNGAAPQDALLLPPTDYTAHVTAPLDPAIPFDQLDIGLQGMGQRFVYLGPSGNLHNLAGPGRLMGLEGTRTATQLFGDQHWPFSQVLTNSPYIMGARIQRQQHPERKFNFGIIIGNHMPPMTEYEFAMAEDYWWADQDEANDGWAGFYDRFHGWRWIPVRPDETLKTPQQMDTRAFGNNVAKWDITWIAQRPYLTKPARMRAFEAAKAGAAKPPPSDLLTSTTPALAATEYYWGSLALANAGDLPSYATFYVTSPGQAIVQDNDSQRLVPLPATVAEVGTFMVDTEQNGNRTLTAANDPQGNLIYDLIRQSQILNYFTAGLTSNSKPLQLQFKNRFIYAVPPQTEVTLTVAHSNPNGAIVAMLPQRYKRSR